jgi:hypothetical protein
MDQFARESLRCSLGFLVFVVVTLGLSHVADAQASMNWTNPSNNEHLVAGATNGVDAVVTYSANIHVVQLYVNGCKMVEQVNDTTIAFLDQAWTNKCPFNVGNNQFIVQALDEANNVVAKQTRNVIGVSGPAGFMPTSVEDAAGNWIVCNQCAGGGGGNPVRATNSTLVPPGSNDESVQFTTVGETGFTGQYGGSYWYVDWSRADASQLPTNTVNYVKYDFEIMMPSGTNASHVQAVEFESQQEFNGKLWNMAWQGDYGNTKEWRIFDYNADNCPNHVKCWLDSGIPLSLKPINDGNWHHITVEFHVDPSAGKVYHDSLWIDGNRFAPHKNNVLNPATTSSTQMTNAFQLDNDKANDGITAYTDLMTVTDTIE